MESSIKTMKRIRPIVLVCSCLGTIAILVMILLSFVMFYETLDFISVINNWRKDAIIDLKVI